MSFPRSRRLENSAQDPSKSEKGHPYRTSAPKGEGGSAKSGQERTWGGKGGQRQNADVRKIENFLKLFNFSLSQMEILTTDNLRKSQ